MESIPGNEVGLEECPPTEGSYRVPSPRLWSRDQRRVSAVKVCVSHVDSEIFQLWFQVLELMQS